MMTDNEIIKALECCSMGSYPACRDCPYHDDYVNRGCINKRNADIKDLINRQKAEIERLTVLAELGNMRANDYRAMRDRALKAEAEIKRLEDVNIRLTKAEAIKEFAERFKESILIHEGDFAIIEPADIDNLVKEMVGDDGGSSEKVQMAGDRI